MFNKPLSERRCSYYLYKHVLVSYKSPPLPPPPPPKNRKTQIKKHNIKKPFSKAIIFSSER